MTFPILGANGAVGGYAIDNSLRFNDNDSPYLERTFSAGDRRTFTFSFWLKRGNLGGSQTLFSNQQDLFYLNSDILGFDFNGGTGGYYYFGNQVFRDVSAWYHIVLAVDTTNATGADRLKLYINGERLTPSGNSIPTQNYQTSINNAQVQVIGKRQSNGDRYLDGYLSEFVFIDGTALTPSSFAEADEGSGIWKPINVSGLDYSGVNSFYLDFENSGSLGTDQSGNGNNFTPTNLASTDQMLDTPTNNFVTMNPLAPTNYSFAQGNLDVQCSTGSEGNVFSTIALSTGKWYIEGYINSNHTGGNFGLADSTGSSGSRQIAGISFNGDIQYTVDGSFTDTGTNWSTGGIIAFAVDIDNKTYNLYYNGTALRTNESYTSDAELFVYARDTSASYASSMTLNFGQDSSFAGNLTRQNNSDGNGYGDFYYTPPSGYLALCTQNLATALSPTIDDGSQYFNTVLYTGTGTTQSITGVGFQPDWTWIKCRSVARDHTLTDSTRGATKTLVSNTTGAETTDASGLTSFDSDGFTLGGANAFNGNTETHASWNWKANGGTTSSNTDGSITSTVQANTTAGFSVITFTSSNTPTQTFGHGLSQAPEFFIVKNRSTGNWTVYHSSLGATKYLRLNLTDASTSSSTFWNDTAPSSSVITLGSAYQAVANLLCYAFHSVEGYSKFGSYTGNGSSDGTFIYTGFRPAWIMIKKTDTTNHWGITDTKRDIDNLTNEILLANSSGTGYSGSGIGYDILSNGFKIRNTDSVDNTSGGTYIYACFSANPFVTSTGIPVTAR